MSIIPTVGFLRSGVSFLLLSGLSGCAGTRKSTVKRCCFQPWATDDSKLPGSKQEAQSAVFGSALADGCVEIFKSKLAGEKISVLLESRDDKS